MDQDKIEQIKNLGIWNNKSHNGMFYLRGSGRKILCIPRFPDPAKWGIDAKEADLWNVIEDRRCSERIKKVLFYNLDLFRD